MADPKIKIREKYKEKNRYKKFGPCLRKIEIHGFRGINNLDFEVDSPITAISGLNGAGKSTLGQLAVCGYKQPDASEDYKRQYIKDFFPVSKADPTPISDDAKVIYHYETDDYNAPQLLTVARAKSSWSGYKRQPERHCYYIGFTVYIPKVERRDLSVYGAKTLELTEKREIHPEVVSKLARVLGHKYDDIAFQGLSHKKKSSEIGMATRLGYSYSENHMGFGEGRVLYTIDKLENSPERSLFILEEPETSLHENAQYELTKYLIDVCNRRHHQIILSTHSSVILNALPAESRKLLIRNEDGVAINNQISVTQARSILSGGHARELNICVEDEFAKTLLREIIRSRKRELLKTIAVHAVGDKDAVRVAKEILTTTGKKAIAVRDPDVGEAPKNGLYKFPGEMPPEKEVFLNPGVQAFFKDEYDLDIPWVIERDKIHDHHDIAQAIANEAEGGEEYFTTLAIKEYIRIIDDEFDELIKKIQNAM